MKQVLRDIGSDSVVAIMIVLGLVLLRLVADVLLLERIMVFSPTFLFGHGVAVGLTVFAGTAFMVSKSNAYAFGLLLFGLTLGVGFTFDPSPNVHFGMNFAHGAAFLRGQALGWEGWRYGLAALSIIGGMAVFASLGGIVLRILRGLWAKAPISKRKTKADRADDSTFGQAKWMEHSELRDDFTGDGGIILGEVYEPKLIAGKFNTRDESTWGDGGNADLIRMPLEFGSGHSLVFAGTNGMKSTGFVIPNALSFTGGLVVVDPKGEIAEIAGAVRAKSGRRVEIISAENGLDPMELLKPLWLDENDTEIFQSLAEWVTDENSGQNAVNDSFFRKQSVQLMSGLFAYYAHQGFDNIIGETAGFLGDAHKSVAAKVIAYAEETDHPYVKKTLRAFAEMAEQTLSGIIANAQGCLGFANHTRMAKIFNGDKRAASGASGNVSDPYGYLLDDNVDIYIQIPVDTITVHPQLLRVFLGALAKRYMRIKVDHATPRRLMIIDEAGRLKKMSLLEVIRDTGRANNLHVMMIYQTLGQIIDHYGREGAKAWFDSASAASYSCVSDPDSLKRIVSTVGSYTASMKSKSIQRRGLSTGAFSENVTRGSSESRREVKLISEDELRTMRDDEQILILRGRDPVRCGKAIYFRRKEWRDLKSAPIVPDSQNPNDRGGTHGSGAQGDNRAHETSDQQDSGESRADRARRLDAELVARVQGKLKVAAAKEAAERRNAEKVDEQATKIAKSGEGQSDEPVVQPNQYGVEL